MIEQWLEPVIQHRSEEISECKLDPESEYYQALLNIMDKKKQMNDAEFNFEIESIFIAHTKSVVEHTYRLGVVETLYFKRMS
jgi:hypothetical protein